MKEIEVKYFVNDLAEVERRIVEAGGKLRRARRHERNLRFDRPSGELVSQAKVLRLRQDGKNLVTFKGPGLLVGGVREREEIEFETGDFTSTQALIEALGYEVVFIYEKHRTNYMLGSLDIALDETPIGDFIEIEGPDGEALVDASRRLGLDWGQRVQESYADLFNILKFTTGFPHRDMVFEHFEAVEVGPGDLGVMPAI